MKSYTLFGLSPHRALRRRTRTVVCALLAGAVLALWSGISAARPGGFHGGAHFNVGGHFQGGFRPDLRPGGPGYQPHLRPEVRPRPLPPGYRRGDYYHYHHGYWPGYAVGVATGAAIGSVVYSLPQECAVTVVNDITYQQCGPTWYRPYYRGGQVTYEVVDPPA